jgi:hypothetical protein
MTGLTIVEEGSPGGGVRFVIRVPANRYRSKDATSVSEGEH